MAGPISTDTHSVLLETARKMACEKGLRGLTVRGVCQAAGVNLGSFVYHFGHRDRFLAELIEQTYAPLFQQLQSEFSLSAPPMDRLRRMLLQLAGFLAQYGPTIAQLVLDAHAGEKSAVDFLRTIGRRHPRLLLKCIREAQSAGDMVPAPPEHALMFLMSSVGLPVVLGHIVRNRPILPVLFARTLARCAADPRCIEQRLEWALRGLSPAESVL